MKFKYKLKKRFMKFYSWMFGEEPIDRKGQEYYAIMGKKLIKVIRVDADDNED